MTGSIYLLRDDGELVGMDETPYDTEDVLQRLLAEHPKLLAGDQMNRTEPRDWLFITRELALSMDDVASPQMWLDHLFLDQDAIPTLIEVKRSSDTRIRREVVGQMLDYAANAMAYLPLATIQAKFEATCEEKGLDPDTVLSDYLGPERDPDEYWYAVKTNLQAGRLRLIFVADEIPSALRRIVEFLNSQMDPTEVLAVEVKQFEGQGLKTLVPRVVGQTAEAEQKKGVARGRQWNESAFFAELGKRGNAEESEVAQRILKWARTHTTEIWWGHGSKVGSFVPTLNHKERDHQLFAVWTNGILETYFFWYQYKPPFDTEERRRDLLDRLNTVPGISLPDSAVSKRPGIPLLDLSKGDALDNFLAVYDWFLEEIKAS